MNFFRVTVHVDLFGTMERIVQADSPSTAIIWALDGALRPPSWAPGEMTLDPWIVGTNVTVRVDQFGPVERPRPLPLPEGAVLYSPKGGKA